MVEIYISGNKIDPYNTSYKEAMTFFAKSSHQKNYKHGALGDAESVFSPIFSKKQGKTFNQDETIDQIMKGMLRF